MAGLNMVMYCLVRLARRTGRRFLLLLMTSVCLLVVYVSLQSIQGHKVKHKHIGMLRVEGQNNFRLSPRGLDDETAYVDESFGMCKRPKMELWHESMLKHFAKPDALLCSESVADWVRVENGTFIITDIAHREHGNIMCEVRPVIRVTDDTEKLGDPIRPFKNGSKVPSDFFESRCLSYKGEVYKNLHSAISPSEEVVQRAKSSKPAHNALGLNVLMFGFDSVSRLNWMRNLPKSHEYFSKKLGGVTLEGYNIVGDGTPQALLPILTGKTEEELPEARRGFHGARTVDGHPWVWKDFMDAGYASQWGEDGALIGTFNYRMLGFDKPPVDHYLRPFQRVAESEYYQRNYAYCLGDRERVDVMLGWVKALFGAYPTTPKFSFLFHSEFSHDAFSKLGLADDALKRFLVSLKTSGYLNNTLLILMSDHGARFVDVRQSQQGKFEERLPYMSLRVPDWFEEKHPLAMRNLRRNAQSLTTPFDIHETFKDVLDYAPRSPSSLSSARGISLFQEIPENRTCKTASIAPHWCSCLEWIETSLMAKRVISASRALVKYINAMTEPERELCSTLTLETIDAAMKFAPNEHFLKFKKSLDDHGRRGDFSDKMQATTELYQIAITTKPGGEKFEATVTLELYNSLNYTVNPKEISRINRYGKQPHCVMERLPHLRPYCYCKHQIQ